VIVTLYRVGQNLNRAVRLCEAMGVGRMECIECHGAYIGGNLYAATGRVIIEHLTEWPILSRRDVALVLSNQQPDLTVSDVKWRDVRRIICGGETDGLPRLTGPIRVAIPMFGKQREHTVEAALAIALWEWRRDTLEPSFRYQRDVAVDLDDTILHARRYRRGVFGRPTEGAAEAIVALRASGRKVFVHTARPRCERTGIERHLAKHGIVVDGILCGKPCAAAYVDDKAVRFEGKWATIVHSILGEVEEHGHA